MASRLETFAQPVKRSPRLSEVVADGLLETILAKGLKPGDRLPSERVLGEQFGVSRTVIREATRTLIAKGMIEVRSGTGLIVADLDGSTVASSMTLWLRVNEQVEYEQVHEVRTLIEVEAAGLAAVRATDPERAELTEIFASMQESATIEDAALADVEFHRGLARLTHNPVLLIVLDSIGDVLLKIREITMPLPGDIEEGIAAHRAILEAVLARDEERARAAMRKHLDGSLRSWRRASAELARHAQPAVPAG